MANLLYYYRILEFFIFVSPFTNNLVLLPPYHNHQAQGGISESAGSASFLVYRTELYKAQRDPRSKEWACSFGSEAGAMVLKTSESIKLMGGGLTLGSRSDFVEISWEFGNVSLAFCFQRGWGGTPLDATRGRIMIPQQRHVRGNFFLSACRLGRGVGV